MFQTINNFAVLTTKTNTRQTNLMKYISIDERLHVVKQYKGSSTQLIANESIAPYFPAQFSTGKMYSSHYSVLAFVRGGGGLYQFKLKRNPFIVVCPQKGLF